MTDSTTAILEIVRKRGLMERGVLAQRYADQQQIGGGHAIHAVEGMIAAGTLCKVSQRETCKQCGDTDRGDLLAQECFVCGGGGIVLVPYLASPEQSAIMEVLFNGPADLDTPLLQVPKGFPVSDPEDGLTLGDMPPEAFDALIASSHVVRLEQECETCGGEGWTWLPDMPGSRMLSLRRSQTCSHCTDGVALVYELVG